MNVILVTHPSRYEQSLELQSHLPVVATVVDNVSAWSGHYTALRMACVHAPDERVVVMEDDAIPVKGFVDQVAAWCLQFPNDMLSFYLGTGRPFQFQRMVDGKIRNALQRGESKISLPTLIHGVCYSIPPNELSRVLDGMEQLRGVREADYAIGAAWGRSVLYPIESLVQHRDDSPVERHPDGQPRVERRVARQLAGPLMFKP